MKSQFRVTTEYERREEDVTEGKLGWRLYGLISSPVLPRPPNDLDFKPHSCWQLNREQNEDNTFIAVCHRGVNLRQAECRQNLGDLQIY